MTLTQKESTLLKDLKGQEELCIGKYEKYANDAKSPELKALFTDMKTTEEAHLRTINDMMNGTVAPVSAPLSANNDHCTKVSYANENDKNADAFLCKDMLTTEKHASSLYDTCVFEFADPAARKLLNHIQAEEQQHGERIYCYMKANGMYS